MMRGMRALRDFKPDRCCHLIGRIANRAFCLTDEERTRFVERSWRVAKFSGIEVPAHCFMSDHFHLLVHLPEAPELGDGELFDRIAAPYSGDRLAEIRKEWEMYARLNDEAGRKRFREKKVGLVSYSTTLTPPLGTAPSRSRRPLWYTVRHEDNGIHGGDSRRGRSRRDGED